MYIKNVVVCIIIAGLGFSCTEEENVEPVVTAPVKFPNADPALHPYFQRFENEAAARGFQVDLTAAGISGVIEEIDQDHIAGQCSYPRFEPNRVTIDKSFWVRGTDLFREFIVFHELGHCYLFRPHLEEILPNRACASIMRSGNGPCLDNYSSVTRSFYIDELFDWDNSALASN